MKTISDTNAVLNTAYNAIDDADFEDAIADCHDAALNYHCR